MKLEYNESELSGMSDCSKCCLPGMSKRDEQYLCFNFLPLAD